MDINGDSVIDYNDQWGLLGSKTAGLGLITSCGAFVSKSDQNGMSFVLDSARSVSVMDKIYDFIHSDNMMLRAEDIKGVSDIWTEIINIFREGRALYRISIMKDIAGLRDMDAILGRDELLIRKLTKITEQIPAAFTAIVGTPVPAVIATDYQALRRMTEKKTGLPCITVETDGTRGYDGFENCTESFLPEIYPVRELGEETARNCVAKVVSDMEKCFNNIKAQNAGPRSIWPIIQYMEGWTAWKRYPTETEVRAMSWAAIACGAHGITWYTYAPGDEKNHGAIYTPETWRIMTTLSKDISELQDVLAERAIKLPQPVVIDGPAQNPLGRDAIVIIAKKHLDKTWVFAVNTVMDPVTAKITIPGCKDVTWRKENRRESLKDSTFTQKFEPYGVKIYIAQ